MKFQDKLVCASALIALAMPFAQANAGYSAAIAAHDATNSAVQSAVRAARDDAARRAMAQQWGSEPRRASRHRPYR